MRNLFVSVTLTAIILGFFMSVALNSFAVELKTGDKAADFSLRDSTGKVYNLYDPEFQGKVLSVFYIDPDARNLNHDAEEVLLKGRELAGNIHYKGMIISNLKASKIPVFLVKSAIRDKKQKTGVLILLDEDYQILRLWGLKNHTSSLVILDKDRVCRYVHNGKLSRADMENVRTTINEYLVK